MVIFFFVKEEFRRLGIGKNIYKEILKNIEQPLDNIYAEKGCKESKKFFSNIGVIVMEWCLFLAIDKIRL